jgi:hypothetical protein
MTPTCGGGGSATQSGTGYQNRVAAWLAVQILAEAEVSPVWGLPSETTVDSIRCEVSLPVDDILVANSASGHRFLQVKHSVDLESSPHCDLASAFDQFIRLFLESKRGEGLSDPVKDPLSIARDRLVLVIGPASSDPLRRDLRKVLSKIRSVSPNLPLDNAVTNKQERKAINVAAEHVRRSWQQAASAQPSDEELREVLSLICRGSPSAP